MGAARTGDDDESLRRQLYRAEAGQADVDRYRAATDESAATPTTAPAQAPAPRPRRHGPLLVALAALAVVAVVVALVLLHRPAERAPSAVAIDGPTRQGFVDALRSGGYAGIAAYLVVHPSPPALRSATRFTTVELHDRGPATRSLRPPGLGEARGRATVLLVVGYAGDAAWSAQAGAVPIAARGGMQQAGELTTATFAYPAGQRPDRLVVRVPDGVPWGAAVVYSD